MVVCDCVLVQEYKNKELVLTLGIVVVQEEILLLLCLRVLVECNFLMLQSSLAEP